MVESFISAFWLVERKVLLFCCLWTELCIDLLFDLWSDVAVRVRHTAHVDVLLQPSITAEQCLIFNQCFPSRLLFVHHTIPPQCANCMWIVSVKLITVCIFRFSGNGWTFVITCMQTQEVLSVCSLSHVIYMCMLWVPCALLLTSQH